MITTRLAKARPIELLDKRLLCCQAMRESLEKCLNDSFHLVDGQPRTEKRQCRFCDSIHTVHYYRTLEGIDVAVEFLDLEEGVGVTI